MDYDPKTEKRAEATAAPKPRSRRRIVAISLLAVIALTAIFVIVAWFAGCGSTERYVAGLDISRTPPVGITAEKHIEEGFAELNVTGKTELKILQLSDIHFGCGIFSLSEDRKLADELIKCVKAVNPDFIAITGDALSPIFVTSGTHNSYREINALTTLFEKLATPYAFCFGNHDGEGTAGKRYVAEKLETAPYSLFMRGTTTADEEGNYYIKINFDGKLTSSLIFLDSGGSTGIRKYAGVSEAGVGRYVSTAEKLKAENPTASNLLFMHVPIPEYDDYYNEYAAGNADYILTSGAKNENVSSGTQNGLYSAIEQSDFTKWVFCGHDHKNNYSITRLSNGITLSYGMSMDFTAYPTFRYKTEYRGGRVIEISDGGAVKTRLVTQNKGYVA